MVELLEGLITLLVEGASAVYGVLQRREERVRTAYARRREDVDRVNAWLRTQGVPSPTVRKERDL